MSKMTRAQLETRRLKDLGDKADTRHVQFVVIWMDDEWWVIDVVRGDIAHDCNFMQAMREFKRAVVRSLSNADNVGARCEMWRASPVFGWLWDTRWWGYKGTPQLRKDRVNMSSYTFDMKKASTETG